MAVEREGDGYWCCITSLAFIMIYLGTSKTQSAVIEKPEATGIERNILKQIADYQQNIAPELRQKLSEQGIEMKCKFTPSCSEYARRAVETYGALKGSALALKRIACCNPLSKGGHDPLE